MNEEQKIEGDIDINQALKEFEEKSAAEQAPQTAEVHEKEVSNIRFEGDDYKYAPSYHQKDVPRMIEWVMKYGGVKEQKTAEYVLLGFAIGIFAISLVVFFNAFRSPATAPTDQIFDTAGTSEVF